MSLKTYKNLSSSLRDEQDWGRGCFSRYLIRNVWGIGSLGKEKTSFRKRRLRNLLYQVCVIWFIISRGSLSNYALAIASLTYFGKAVLEKPNDLILTTDDFDCHSCNSQSQSNFSQSFSVKTQKTLKSCIVPAQLAFN